MEGGLVDTIETRKGTAEVRRVSYDELVQYWKEVDHFKDPNKVYTEVLSKLGPFTSEYENPRRISYGLFIGKQMMGATHVTQWTEKWIRFRTINIRESLRGEDLGWKLLTAALAADWKGNQTLFGWFRRSAYTWALAHGFEPVDGKWHGQHIGVWRANPGQSPKRRR